MSKSLQRLDEKILQDVDEFLEDTEKIPTRTGVRLTLTLMRGIYTSLNAMVEHVENQNGRVGKLEELTQKLEKANIIFWMQSNPRLSVVLLLVAALALDIIHDYVSIGTTWMFIKALFQKFIGI